MTTSPAHVPWSFQGSVPRTGLAGTAQEHLAQVQFSRPKCKYSELLQPESTAISVTKNETAP